MTAYLNGKPVHSFFLDGEKYEKAPHIVRLILKKDTIGNCLEESVTYTLRAGSRLCLYGPLTNWWCSGEDKYLENISDGDAIARGVKTAKTAWNASFHFLYDAKDIEAQLGGGN